jgi:nitroreductase
MIYIRNYNLNSTGVENKKEWVNSFIRSRKSTFTNGLMLDGKIEDAVIEELLENATWAPSHGLVQAWQFKVFAGDGVATFFLKLQEIYKESTPTEKFKEEKYKKYPEKANCVSHIVVIICRRDEKHRFPKQEDLVSVACALQNIYLSLDAYGISGYLSTGDVCYTQAMRNYLSLGSEDECLGFFILGIARPDAPKPIRKRISAKEKTVWIRS